MSTRRLVLIVVAFLTASSLRAQDATVVITQDALNAYAMAVGTVAHSTHVRITFELPDVCRLLATGDPTSTLDCRPPREAVLVEGELNWSIQTPRFVVTPAGMNFQALLQATLAPGGAFYRNITIPATISYDNTSKVLMLTVAGDAIPIVVTGFFGRVTVASIVPGLFYSTKLGTPTETFSFALPGGSRTVEASVSSMQITYGTRQVVLRPSLTIE